MPGYGDMQRAPAERKSADGGAADHRTAAPVHAPATDTPAAALNRSPRSQSLVQLRAAFDKSPRVQALQGLTRTLNRTGAPEESDSDQPQQEAIAQLVVASDEAGNPDDPPPSAPIQKKPNTTGLPDRLKEGVEHLSGLAMDDVRVHYNSPKPAIMQAHAYAQGIDIHVAPGQEKHLPHEAWHVVQQKQGRVKPTLQMKGVAIDDNSGLAHEADAAGERWTSLEANAAKPIADRFNVKTSDRSVVQRVKFEDLKLGPKSKKILNCWLVYQMFIEKKNTPEEILDDLSILEVQETTAAWSEGANAAFIEHMAMLLSGVARERKMSQLLLTEKQIVGLEAKLGSTGKGDEVPHYITLAAIKHLTYDDILGMAAVNSAAVAMGFPPVFKTKELWGQFCAIVRTVTQKTGLQFTEIVLQGSAVRKENPKDIDIGVLLTMDQLEIYLTMEDLISKVIYSSDDKDQIGDEKNRNANKEGSVNKGKIEARYFPATKDFLDGREIIQVWLGANLGMKEKVQLSMILIGSRFDLKPNFKIA